MKCPGCGRTGTGRVLNSRNRECYIHRRRECTVCGLRYTTVEMVFSAGKQTQYKGPKKAGKGKEHERGAAEEVHQPGDSPRE